MKKTLSFIAVFALISTAVFAQQSHRNTSSRLVKSEVKQSVKPTLRAKQAQNRFKAAGDTVSTFPWTEGFESGAPNVTFIDSDGDGFNWEISTSSTMKVHSGEGVVFSASYDNDLGEALTPDNWMILPCFTIPTSGNDFLLSWWTIGQDASYAEENYSVYVSVNGNTPAAFSATTAAYTGTSSSVWEKHFVDLGRYAGQTIAIAFRHHDITDLYRLNIDDIRIGGPEPPEVTLDGPLSALRNEMVTFTATGATTFSWSVNDTLQEATTDEFNYTFTYNGIHKVVASATNVAGTGSDTLFVNVYSCEDGITALPYEENFEDPSLCWEFITNDTVSNGFYVYPSGGYLDDGARLIGTYSDDGDVDQWAISPLITIPSDQNSYILKFYAKTREWEGVENHYEVYVLTGEQPEDYHVVYEEESGNSYYQPHTISLDPYAGQTIRIAFHNITLATGDALAIDQIYVGLPVAPDMSLSGETEVRAGEPYTYYASTDAESVVWSVNGAVQSGNSTTFTYTFPAAGVYTIKASATNVAGTTEDEMTVTAIQCDSYDLPYIPDLANDVNICWDNEGWDITDDGNGTYFIYSYSNLWGFFDLDPDNWFVTPSLNMPATGNYEIAWQVQAMAPELPSDHYGVYVIQGGTATLLHDETLDASVDHFSQRAVGIPASVTGEFKVAFRHYETTGGYAIGIANPKVVAAGSTQGIDDVEANGVALYPNPAHNMLHIDAEGMQQVQILDINGRLVLTQSARDINVSSLTNGVYIVRVITSNGVSTNKFVKE
jgi:hypothetical protein